MANEFEWRFGAQCLGGDGKGSGGLAEVDVVCCIEVECGAIEDGGTCDSQRSAGGDGIADAEAVGKQHVPAEAETVREGEDSALDV